MTERDNLAAKLRERALQVGVAVGDADLSRFSQYYDLLVRWNRRINLTGLQLAGCPAGTLDRLFIEPLLANRHIEEASATWLDVGSGGGSPAIPLKIVRPRFQLVMTEPRTRKAAFLREVVRRLALEGTEVLDVRVEEAALTFPSRFDMVTVRGVRLDGSLVAAMRDCLKPGGHVWSFGMSIPSDMDGLVAEGDLPLVPGKAREAKQQRLFLYARARMFHVEQPRRPV